MENKNSGCLLSLKFSHTPGFFQALLKVLLPEEVCQQQKGREIADWLFFYDYY